jgi:signal transduction histidine kinase
MRGYPNTPLPEDFSNSSAKDEIGLLNRQFGKLCTRLETSQKKLNEAQEQVFQSEKQAALGRLVAGISHEINNPLGGMQNCVQTMKRNKDKPDLQDRYLVLLGQGIDRIKGTVQQLLNIGRNEPLEIKTEDIDGMIRDAMELICMGHRQITLDLQLHVGRPVTTGIEALRQVIINLGGNAVQAIGRQNGKITIISRLVKKNYLQIQVCDDGPGIAPEHLDKIFEPFFTTKEVGEGTGLGLSVSHSLINQLGGTLTAANLPDGGAYFTLTVPLLSIEDPK